MFSHVLTHCHTRLAPPLYRIYFFHPLGICPLFTLLPHSCNAYVLYLSIRHMCVIDFTFNAPDAVYITFNLYSVIANIICAITTFLFVANRNQMSIVHILRTGSWRHVPAFTGTTLVFEFPLSRPFLLHITGNLRIIDETIAYATPANC